MNLKLYKHFCYGSYKLKVFWKSFKATFRNQIKFPIILIFFKSMILAFINKEKLFEISYWIFIIVLIYYKP